MNIDVPALLPGFTDPSTTPDRFEPLLNVTNAAQSLGLHPKTVLRMARESRIPAFHVGRYWLFRASLLDQWLNRQLQFPLANPVA